MIASVHPSLPATTPLMSVADTHRNSAVIAAARWRFMFNLPSLARQAKGDDHRIPFGLQSGHGMIG